MSGLLTSERDEKEVLVAAGKLAEFSNLEPNQAQAFRQKNPEFVPEVWWTSDAMVSQEPPPKVWEAWQNYLQNAWTLEFPLDETLELLTFYSNTTPPEDNPFAPAKAFPYQRAILFLSTQTWRAKFCECGKRFVKDKPQRRFCSILCASKHRKEYKRAMWAQHPEWGRDRKKNLKPSKKRNKVGGK